MISWENSMTNTLSLKEIQRKYDLLFIHQIIFLFCFSYCSDFITVDDKRVISPAHILNMRLTSWSTFSLGLKFQNPSYWNVLLKMVISCEHERPIIVKLCVHFCVCVCVSKSLRKWTQTDTKVTFHHTHPPPTHPPGNFFWS